MGLVHDLDHTALSLDRPLAAPVRTLEGVERFVTWGTAVMKIKASVKDLAAK